MKKTLLFVFVLSVMFGCSKVNATTTEVQEKEILTEQKKDSKDDTEINDTETEKTEPVALYSKENVEPNTELNTEVVEPNIEPKEEVTTEAKTEPEANIPETVSIIQENPDEARIKMAADIYARGWVVDGYRYESADEVLFDFDIEGTEENYLLMQKWIDYCVDYYLTIYGNGN